MQEYRVVCIVVPVDMSLKEFDEPKVSEADELIRARVEPIVHASHGAPHDGTQSWCGGG